MPSYRSGTATIQIDQQEPSAPGAHAALLLLHGSGGASQYWLSRFAPAMAQSGMAAYAPHYFEKTGTQRASAETILDGIHFPQWLAAAKDAVTYIAARPSVDARRIAVLGISLGGYLAMAMAAEEPRMRAVIELSGGMPPGWENRLSPATAPVLILHGEKDDIVPVSEARKLANLLTEKQVRHQVKLFPMETHWFSASAQPALLMTCASFLGQHLR